MFPANRTISFAAVLFALSLGPLSRPAFSQAEFSGQWGQEIHEDEPERRPGPEIGDYTGLPINDAARMKADSWDPQKWEMIEHECEAMPADYAARAPGDIRVTPEVDRFTQGIIAWHSTVRIWLQERMIYMDGRPHPTRHAAHTWQGFSTGEWEADMLKVKTTHLKEGWLKRNGLPRSVNATLTEYFIRHGNYLTLVTNIEDPAYLTEPLIRSSNWILAPGDRLLPNYCLPSVHVSHPKGWVAHYLPGENKWLNEFAYKWGIPVEAVRGGAETMYPEYQEKLAKMPLPPTPSAEKK
jgi:hypothetical protein